MITIQKHQIKAMQDDAARRFLTRARQILRDFWSAELAASSDEALELWLRRARDAAGRYDIVTEKGLLRFFNLRLAFGGFDLLATGPEFPERRGDRWATEILRDADLDEAGKLDELAAELKYRAGHAALGR